MRWKKRFPIKHGSVATVTTNYFNGYCQKKKKEIDIFSHLIQKGKHYRQTDDDKLTECISIRFLHMQEYCVWRVHYFRYGSHHVPPQFHWLGAYTVYPKLYWQAIETALPDDAAHLKSN